MLHIILLINDSVALEIFKQALKQMRFSTVHLALIVISSKRLCFRLTYGKFHSTEVIHQNKKIYKAIVFKILFQCNIILLLFLNKLVLIYSLFLCFFHLSFSYFSISVNYIMKIIFSNFHFIDIYVYYIDRFHTFELNEYKLKHTYRKQIDSL